MVQQVDEWDGDAEGYHIVATPIGVLASCSASKYCQLSRHLESLLQAPITLDLATLATEIWEAAIQVI